MRRYLLYLPFCLFFAVFCACSKSNLQAPVPSYIQIDTALVSVTSPSIQGTTSNKITDIWLYVDQKFKGAYPIGHLIPVVSSGSTDIIIYPGIKNNGISATRLPYVFLQGLNINLNLQPTQTIHYKPLFPYKTAAVFQQVEGFEGNGICFTNAPDASCATTTISGTDVFEGAKCLSMSKNMTDATPLAKIKTSITYPLPASGAAVYMELNYKTNQPVEIGVYSTGGERPAMTLNPSDGWNKIYISLTSVVSNQPVYPYNGVYIKAQKQTSSPEIYIDNFKLISD